MIKINARLRGPLICLIVVFILTVAGMFFLGKGITGLVIGETCCMGVDCEEENLCDILKLQPESGGDDYSFEYLFLGIIFMIASIGLAILMFKVYMRQKYNKT